MDFLGYHDWSEVSGLSVADSLPMERYRTLQPLISASGLTVIVVADLLRETAPELDLISWRKHGLHEFPPDRKERADLTIASLEAIGAVQAAAVMKNVEVPMESLTELFSGGLGEGGVRKALESVNLTDLMKNIQENIAYNLPRMFGGSGKLPDLPQSESDSSSITEHESRGEIERLLQRYAETCDLELQADIDRHGDPRILPGYSRKERLRELQQMREGLLQVELQKLNVRKLKGAMNSIRKQSGKKSKQPELARLELELPRRELMEIVKEAREIPAKYLIPEMSEMLEQVDQFKTEFPELFIVPSDHDAQTTARLAALGEYETDSPMGEMDLTWESPQGFDADWGKFSLELLFSRESPRLLPRLLDAAERLSRNISERSESWKQEIISHFRQVYWPQIGDWELDDYELDDDEEPTDESIIDKVESARIRLELHSDVEDVQGKIWFAVEFDDEHGYEIDLSDDPLLDPPSEIPAGDLSAGFDTSSIDFSDSGEPVSSEQIDQFENRFKVKVPDEYRSFLLTINGGRPGVKSSILLKSEGSQFDVDLVRLFSVSGNFTEPLPEGSLEGALHVHQETGWPETLFPIGELRKTGIWQSPGLSSAALMHLYIVTAGNKLGKLVAVDVQSYQAMLSMNQSRQFAVSLLADAAKSSISVAIDLQDLFQKRLREPEKLEVPDWLKAIRSNDVSFLKSWMADLRNGQKTFQDRGWDQPLSVIDYLALEASAEMLLSLFRDTPAPVKQLLDSWVRVTWRSCERFRVLMNILPKSEWKRIFISREVWNHPEILEELAAGGVNFNQPVDEEGQTPIHLATRQGSVEAVRWLMRHGANPHQYDKYRRNAFTWTESGAGYDCLKVLKGEAESTLPSRPPAPDVAGIGALKEASDQLPEESSIVVVMRIKSPPVSEQEKRIYSECQFNLHIDVKRNVLVIKDVSTPRQTYMTANPWPAVLFAPIIAWPELIVEWEHFEVVEYDWKKATNKRNYQPKPRPDLLQSAKDALHQALDPEEAASRQVRIKK